MTPEELDLVATRLANSWYVGNTERFARALLAERTRTETLRAALEEICPIAVDGYGDQALDDIEVLVKRALAASVEETP